ncbi:VQ motif-containing protein 10-like [Abrus precatorius]|uniref:VQ motif-containing protein 10-like n=1 Tax=Abrus precatorius TaxID=3816 RepID=A0A8B8K514_ABRPR|nr:VQ motif-containing protein 10-like [Abrus precatorius]
MARGGEPLKIVQIETRYVQTDAVNFRDVVQRLTGKNSSTAWIGRRNAASALSSSEIIEGVNHAIAKPHDWNKGAASNGTLTNDLLPSSMLMNNYVSSKDFDALLLELPRFDVMPSSYS